MYSVAFSNVVRFVQIVSLKKPPANTKTVVSRYQAARPGPSWESSVDLKLVANGLRGRERLGRFNDPSDPNDP